MRLALQTLFQVDGDNYEYAYSVDQPDSNFGQIEAKEGKDVVGAYEVSNAHGQQQSISYSVSDNSGFNANVTYKHPDGYMYSYHENIENPEALGDSLRSSYQYAHSTSTLAYDTPSSPPHDGSYSPTYGVPPNVPEQSYGVPDVQPSINHRGSTGSSSSTGYRPPTPGYGVPHGGTHLSSTTEGSKFGLANLGYQNPSSSTRPFAIEPPILDYTYDEYDLDATTATTEVVTELSTTSLDTTTLTPELLEFDETTVGTEETTTIATTTIATTTVAETTVAETTVSETTVAETTVAETTEAVTTAAPETTTVPETTPAAETTPVPETTAAPEEGKGENLNLLITPSQEEIDLEDRLSSIALTVTSQGAQDAALAAILANPQLAQLLISQIQLEEEKQRQEETLVTVEKMVLNATDNLIVQLQAFNEGVVQEEEGVAPILPPLLQTLQVLLTAPRAVQVQTSPQVQVSVEVESVTGSPPTDDLEGEIEDAIEEAVASSSRRKRKGSNQGVHPERGSGSRKKAGGKEERLRTEKPREGTNFRRGGRRTARMDGTSIAKDVAMGKIGDVREKNLRGNNEKVDGGMEESYKRNKGNMDGGMEESYKRNKGNMDEGMEENFRRNNGRMGEEMVGSFRRNKGNMDGGMEASFRRSNGRMDEGMAGSFRRNNGRMDGGTEESSRRNKGNMEGGMEESYRRSNGRMDEEDLVQGAKTRTKETVRNFSRNNGEMDAEMLQSQDIKNGKMAAGMGVNFRRTDVGIEKIAQGMGETFKRKTAKTEAARRLQRTIAEEERAAREPRNRNARANALPKEANTSEGMGMGKKLVMAAAKAVLRAEDEANAITAERLEDQTLPNRCKVLQMLGILWLAPFCHQDVLHRYSK
ncbi:uncharacterized protein LOC131878046 [Tigriopus californicus]|uniref:uncharacterized protein LOC131878046 n=1 Tax=Tigriopus californicus TaxID=6832 RepID=UPI0027D9F2BC|nr:uncharacterized protein LOC131878046 [Tigriopus californicus]